MYGAATADKRGKGVVFHLAKRLYDFGISEHLAYDLIRTINKPPFEAVEIRHQTYLAYSTAVNPPRNSEPRRASRR